jgi:hypothetical protein
VRGRGAELAVADGQAILDLTALGDADAPGRKLTPQTPVLLASLNKNSTLIFEVGVVAFLWRYLPTACDTTTIQPVLFDPDLGVLVLA